jgi:pimeloyl-ACP methyl ester carboxylesterase
MKFRENVFTVAVAAFLFTFVCVAFAFFIHNNQDYPTSPLETSVDFKGALVDVSYIGKGSPTVLFEPGLNENYTTFNLIQEEISKLTGTFTYNRISIAYSENKNKTRSSLGQVQDLHNLLSKLKIKPPYIIVAHSIAGYNARLFAEKYPGEIKGILFIDCSHENQSFRNVASDPEYTELCLDELYTSQNQLRESREKDALRNIPITVLTADYAGTSDYEFMKSYWRPLQDDLASLSNKSKHILVKDSGHMIQVEHPDLVINEIKALLKLVQR